MNKLIIAFLVLITFNMEAQQSEEDLVKSTIIDFFDAFHKQDTVALKSMAKGNIILQSISLNKEGESVLSEDKYTDFIKNIASIPKDKTFEEKILSYNIKIDGHMANAWTPYEFWFDGKFSHCGVNSFQLIKEDSKWKLIYLVDTRRREDCTK